MPPGASFNIPAPKPQGIGGGIEDILSSIGPLLARGGETGLGALLGPTALQGAFQDGKLPGFGQMSPLQQGGLIRSALPDVSFTKGNRTLNLGGGGGGITQAMMMQRLMSQLGNGGGRSGRRQRGGSILDPGTSGINPQAQTRTVRQLLEPPTLGTPLPQGPNLLQFA